METKRRPIKARDTRWAAATARLMLRLGLKPNQVSVMSAVFGCAAGLLFWLSSVSVSSGTASMLLLGAAVSIQLRLLCNLFDGMLAVEGGLKSPVGELYNELPDRISDVGTLLGAGCALSALTGGLALGWSAAVAAVLTAYIRTLGVAAGAQNIFLGPCAKQQRMAIMTGAAVIAAGERYTLGSTYVLLVALVVVAIGSVVTCVRRLKLIAEQLNANSQ